MSNELKNTDLTKNINKIMKTVENINNIVVVTNAVEDIPFGTMDRFNFGAYTKTNTSSSTTISLSTIK